MIFANKYYISMLVEDGKKMPTKSKIKEKEHLDGFV
jgi:hypothetical protein